MTDDLTGKVIKSYELRERIGAGGFGAVYRAQQKFIGREVAVKIILPQYANRPEFIRRFETEAQIVARLEHPYIVPLYDYWREPDGAYLVMRWLRGGSVLDYLREHGPISPATVSQLLNQVAEALTVAHRQNVIHRDLKPENIMMDDDGNTYLSDFGIAKDLGGENITQNNAIVGSPAYLSPEQIQGEKVTHHSDIYALGLVLYEMLTGERPFTDPSPATLMYKHLSEPVPDVSLSDLNLPVELNFVIQRATAKDPELRYEDAISLARDFRKAVKGRGLIDTDEVPMQTALMTSSTGIMLPEPDNPYKGLRAFQQADAADFFGRGQLIENILDRMREDVEGYRFLAIVGPSGSGKSSVVKAGIIPSLRGGVLPGSENWFNVEMVPGLDPLEELEAALLRVAVNPPDSLLTQLREDERGLMRAVKRVLPQDDTQLVIAIDQFEELFTLVEDEATRTHFLNSLVVAATEPRSRVYILLTLRADFYDRPLNYARFGELMRRRTEIVLPLTNEEIEETIIGPARRVGMQIETGLVNAIVSDVSEQPGTLPLLQYALTELFERRDGHVMTAHSYTEIGGTMGALARRADELYDSLGQDGQEAARQLFLRLVTLGEGAEDTRRRAFQSNLLSIGSDPDTMEMVIDAFGRYRLLTFDHDSENRAATVEVAHEALIRQWKRLRGWLDDSREDLRIQRRLMASAQEWIRADRDASYLARGAQLEQLEEWRANTNLALNEGEREYLDASMAERIARLEAERARAEREAALERRSRNQLRLLGALMTVAAVVGFILAFFAFTQRQQAVAAQEDAETNAVLAQESADEARSLALAANARNALIEENPMLGLSLALKAGETYQPAPVEVQRVLATTAYSPGVSFRFPEHDGAILDTVITDEYSIASTIAGAIHVWDNTTHELTLRITLPGEALLGIALSPDGERIVAGASDGNIYIFDSATGAEIQQLSGHEDSVTAVTYTVDGTGIVSGSYDTNIILWDAETGEEIRRFTGHTGIVLDLAVSPDGEFIGSSSGDATVDDTSEDEEDRTLRVWRIETGEEHRVMTPPTGFLRSVTFSPDSRRVATASWNSIDSGVITMWHIPSGRESQRFYGHRDVVTDLRFTPEGNHIMSGSWDGTLRLWDIQTGVEADRFVMFEDRVQSITISDDGETALVGTGNPGNNRIAFGGDSSIDASLWKLDLRERSLIQEMRGHRDWVWSVDVSPDGQMAVSGSGQLRNPVDTSIRLWNLETGEEIRQLNGHSNTVEGLAFSPDGERIVSGAWDGKVLLWSVDGALIRQMGEGNRSHEGSVATAIFSPDSRHIASGDGDGQIILWDAETGEEIRRFVGHEGNVSGLAFNADGTQLASAGWDTTVRLWDVETGEEIEQFTGHVGRVNDVAFSTDNQRILSGSWDTTVRLWDIASGSEIRAFIGHNGFVQGVALSEDGRFVLSGASDLTMRLWEVASGQELYRYAGHGDWVSEVVFTQGGSAVSSAQDGVVRYWRVPSEADTIIEWAQENRHIAELSCEQRERYRVEPLCEEEQ